MKVKPKEVFINVPVVLLFDSEDEAAKFASGVNTIMHGKVKLKYDNLGVLGDKEAVIFYLQRNDEYHSLRDEFVQLIEQEEILKDQPSLQELQEEKDRENDRKLEIASEQIYPYANAQDEEEEMSINSPFLSKDEMLKLNTKRLLSYKKKLLSYHEGPNWDSDGGIDKTNSLWQEAYKNVKEILASREHVEK